jgi:amidase
LFEPALERAEELDKHFSKTRKPIGPLHGLPISLKDQFHAKGGETTMAYVGWIETFEGEKGTGKEGKFESELVRELVSLGAIPIAKASCFLHMF